MLGSFTVSTIHYLLYSDHSSYKSEVTGHGVPQEIIDNLLTIIEAYFSLPLEVKMKVSRPLF